VVAIVTSESYFHEFNGLFMFMSGFAKRLAEVLVKSLSQEDLDQVYIYISYLQVCLTSLYLVTTIFLGSIVIQQKDEEYYCESGISGN
jgi:hypothetical protein